MATVRACTGEQISVFNIESESLAEVYRKAADVLEENDNSYANLTVDQVFDGDDLLYSGILYIH